MQIEASSVYVSASFGGVGVTGYSKFTSVLQASDLKVILNVLAPSLADFGSKVTAKYFGSQISTSEGMIVLYFKALSKRTEL